MNYLAHAYASVVLRHSPGRLAGNVLADAMKRDPGWRQFQLPPEVEAGRRFHQWMDACTDAHPRVRQCRALLRTTTGRCTPIVLDVAFDFLLAETLPAHGGPSLRDAADAAYGAITSQFEQLPPQLREFAEGAIAADWLTACRTLDGVEAALARIAARRPRIALQPEVSRAAIVNHLPAMEHHFAAFFPELLAAGNVWERPG